MLSANYKTKKELKGSIGHPLRYQETSWFGTEYKETGIFYVVGPSPHERKWYAKVILANGRITKVS